MTELYKATIRVAGIVQGVGFRPFTARLAEEYRLSGYVKNQSGHVLIEAVGEKTALEGFLKDISERRPSGSFLASVESEFVPAPPKALTGFSILPSDEAEGAAVMPSPDIAVCDDCLKELFTEGDPRYLNPFISCTNCGPRFSIVKKIPYDRCSTSMDAFPMCPLCAREYKEPKDRRFHAQTVCCNACGPTLFYTDRNGVKKGADALSMAIDALNGGRIVAVKGIGGYHLATSPFRAESVKALRALKGREQKPFAVMFQSLASIGEHCIVNEREAELLTSSARPIVLLDRKPSPIAKEVYGSSRSMGAFLPYTPLHHLLLKETGPLVLTSANPSGLPIMKDDAEALAFFEKNGLLSGVLWNDRKIVRRLDDSVAAVVGEKLRLLRRARGYVPFPTRLAGFESGFPPILCAGAQEKSAFCLAYGGFAYVSAETGALDTREAVSVYESAVPDMERTLQITPELIACDPHPYYEATRYAQKRGLPIFYVQHHFAHIASVMAEHGLKSGVLGAAFDGTGYGADGTIWGGEFISAQNGGFERAGHLKPVKLFASDDSVYQAWKSALCYLYDAGLYDEARAHAYGARFELIGAALNAEVNTLLSSSMGRAFDAVSSLLNVCHESDYDGQSAIELENAAARYQKEAGLANASPLPYAMGADEFGPVIDLAPAFAALCAEKKRGAGADELAYRFHLTVCAFTLEAFRALREKTGLKTAALSGGVFQNRLLSETLEPLLEQAGFSVYRNEAYPPGDGCIPLGQGYAALLALEKNQKKE
ncbi:MAG: carbamoyltransferase HypF [Clostridiaceae bacterium]|nr:carbamoyltransferase HypF [Eubacteriales bacterium]